MRQSRREFIGLAAALLARPLYAAPAPQFPNFPPGSFAKSSCTGDALANCLQWMIWQKYGIDEQLSGQYIMLATKARLPKFPPVRGINPYTAMATLADSGICAYALCPHRATSISVAALLDAERRAVTSAYFSVPSYADVVLLFSSPEPTSILLSIDSWEHTISLLGLDAGGDVLYHDPLSPAIRTLSPRQVDILLGNPANLSVGLEGVELV